MSVAVNTLAQHSPAGGLALFFLLLGGLIHTGRDSETVKIGTLLECSRAAGHNGTVPMAGRLEFVTGFYEAAIFIAVAAPLVPFALDPLRKWNDVKTQAVGTHLLGQSSSFGISEVLRYVGYWPNDLFLTAAT